MATDFYTRFVGDEFQITLETDRPEHFEFMQKAARICVDGKSADFVPVVRCKECKYRMPRQRTYETLLCANEYWSRSCFFAVPENFFCGFGEREGGVNLTDNPELMEDKNE